MPIHVRLVSPEALDNRLKATDALRSEIAQAAGISPARLSQLAHGVTCGLDLDNAELLEDALSVKRGTLFALDERDEWLAESARRKRLSPYISARTGAA